MKIDMSSATAAAIVIITIIIIKLYCHCHDECCVLSNQSNEQQPQSWTTVEDDSQSTVTGAERAAVWVEVITCI